VRRLVEHPPVQAAVLGPLRQLPEVLAHEQQLLARVPPHVAEEGAHVRELLPVVARHLREQLPLPCTTSSWLIGRMKFSLNA
jgi:hypothetical protein